MFVKLSVAGDGLEALAILRREGQYDGAVCPDLMKDGRAVLAEIKHDPEEAL